MALFQREAQDRGAAIVIVTHDNRILDSADRIVKMDFGRIARDARVKEATLIDERMSKCGVFRGVSSSTLNQLADEMRTHRVVAGTRVISQGEAGELFYLIREGRFLVSRNGVPLKEVETGDYFGETALITGEHT